MTCLFAQLSSVLVFAAQLLLPSLSGERRIRLLLDEAYRELSRLDSGRARHLAPEEAAFRDAARIEQILTAKGATAPPPQVVAEALRCFDEAVVLRRCHAELDRLAETSLGEAVRAARAALTLRDGGAILTAAEALRQTAAQENLSIEPVLAALVPASIVFEPSQSFAGSGQGTHP
ncbi:hypothetical protein ACQ5SK_37720 [Bradyrhizobium japonicum]